jgi:hypothetical protein
MRLNFFYGWVCSAVEGLYLMALSSVNHVSYSFSSL